jgi:hypothetical protein
MLTALSSLLASIFGYFPGKKIGFGGREAKTSTAHQVNRSDAGVRQRGSFQLDEAFRAGC